MNKLFTRGGQTWFHNFRMTYQVVSRMGKYMFCLWLVVTLVLGWLFNGSEQTVNSGMYGIAYLLHYFGGNHLRLPILYHGQIGHETVWGILNDHYYTVLLAQGMRRWYAAALLGGLLSGIAYWQFSRYLTRKGETLTEDKFVSGAKLVDAPVLAKQLRRTCGVSDIYLDRFPLPKDFEVCHVLLNGTTGAGKTQALMKLLTAIRRRGDKVILSDSGGVLTQHFFQEQSEQPDRLLSPLDARGETWDCWEEGDDWEDYNNIAEALIPLSGREDPFWITASRSLFSHALDKMKDDPHRSHSQLLSLLLREPLGALHQYFSDTDAAMIANQEIEKTTTCIRTVIAVYLKSLRLLDKRDDVVRYGVVQTDKTPTENAVITWMKATEKDAAPFMHLLVFIREKKKLIDIKFYRQVNYRLKQEAVKSDKHKTIQDAWKKLALTLTAQDKPISLLAANPKHRAFIEALHSILNLSSPFAQPFSIREWIKNDEDTSWVFMPYTADNRHALRPLLSLWLDLACMNLMRRPLHSPRRIWIVLDELPTLHRLPSLEAMAEARKYSGCFVLGFQSISQIRSLYGIDDTETLMNLVNTRLFFRSNTHQIAKWVSNELGEQVLDRCQENYSYGASPVRDGVSIGHQRVKQPVVSAAEVQALSNLSCYVKLAGEEGNLPITQITLTYQTYRRVYEAFVPITAIEDGEVDKLLHHYTAKYPLQTYTLSKPIQVDYSKDKIKKPEEHVSDKQCSQELEGNF